MISPARAVCRGASSRLWLSTAGSGEERLLDCYRVGLTDIRIIVSHPSFPRRRTALSLLVDSGAIYSVLPWPHWRRLGLKADDELEFTFADGTTVKRQLSEARFHFRGRSRVSPVLLGETGDAGLLGVVTLETLGLALNPLRRELVPFRAILAQVSQSVFNEA